MDSVQHLLLHNSCHVGDAALDGVVRQQDGFARHYRTHIFGSREEQCFTNVEGFSRFRNV